MIDLHNHILSEIDDGSRSMEETIEMARIAVEEGISKIIATPHHRKPEYLVDKDHILEKIKNTNQVLKKENIDLKVLPGMEIYMSRDIPEKLANKELLSLNNSSYILIEFPMREELDYIEDVLHEVKIQGYRPIIAHPERYKKVIEDPNYVKRLIEGGCLFQINANSLTGAFGEESKKTVEILIKHKMVHLISTDSHSSKRRSPRIRQALECVRAINGDQYVEVLLDNANKVLNDEKIQIEKPCLYEKKKGFFKKAKRFLRLSS